MQAALSCVEAAVIASSLEQFAQYCSDIENTATWGGQLEVSKDKHLGLTAALRWVSQLLCYSCVCSLWADTGTVTCLSGDRHGVPGRVSTHRGWRGVQPIPRVTHSLVSQLLLLPQLIPGMTLN